MANVFNPKVVYKPRLLQDTLETADAFRKPCLKKVHVVNHNHTHNFISLRRETAITSTAAVQSERQDSAQGRICVVIPSGPEPTLAVTLGHRREARCFFPFAQWALHQEHKNMFYIYTIKLLYFYSYCESLSHWWFLLFASIKQVRGWCSVLLLVTWLWFCYRQLTPTLHTQ